MSLENLRLLNRIAALGPECTEFRKALLGQEVAFAHEILDMYDKADEDSRPDMIAFFDSEGPRRMHESKKRREDGTPTSSDLEKWIGEDHED